MLLDLHESSDDARIDGVLDLQLLRQRLVLRTLGLQLRKQRRQLACLVEQDTSARQRSRQADIEKKSVYEQRGNRDSSEGRQYKLSKGGESEVEV